MKLQRHLRLSSYSIKTELTGYFCQSNIGLISSVRETDNRGCEFHPGLFLWSLPATRGRSGPDSALSAAKAQKQLLLA